MLYFLTTTLGSSYRSDMQTEPHIRRRKFLLIYEFVGQLQE